MKILAYVEPHPIRNSHTQFAHAGKLFTESLSSAAATHELDFLVFANAPTAEILASDYPEVQPRILRPTVQEQEAISSAFDVTWDDSAIGVWQELVLGQGAAAELYANILRRIHDQFAFDAVLLWSENGAVRKVASERQACVIHGELGPTRSPFPATIYFDACGTNGNASVRRIPETELLVAKQLPTQTWLAAAAQGLIESSLIWPAPEVASILPRGPFAFVPLQLADDLNTICHSSFGSPESFLRQLLPQLLDRGLSVVLKGHPAASARPYNLRQEELALRWARSLGSKVAVLPRESGPAATLACIAQASLVCTINSSVGFEAMLLGKPCTVLGDAMYDPGGVMKARGLDGWDRGEACCNRIVNYLMGHYLLPVDRVRSGDALMASIELIHAERERGQCFDAAFWGRWTNRMDFGLRQLQGQPDRPTGGRSAVELLSTLLFGELHDRDDHIELRAFVDGAHRVFSARRAPMFAGTIDEVEWRERSVRVRGWAFDHQNGRPPALVLIASERNIVGCRPLSAKRPDVAEALQHPAASGAGFDLEIPIEPARGLRLMLLTDRLETQELSVELGPFAP